MHEQLLDTLRDEFAAAAPFAPTAASSTGSFTYSPIGLATGNSLAISSTNNDILSPLSINFRILLVFASFLLPYLAFLVILPGVREKRVASFIAITIQIGVGVLLMGSLVLPYWKVGDATIISQFHSYSRQRHEANLGINVGLDCINVTLKYLSTMNTIDKPFRGLYLNERFQMSGVETMTNDLQTTYRKGLPYPLLKVIEYFSLSQGAFAWGRLYRNAGYYAGAILWFSFAIWVLQCFLLALVPHYYSKAGILCGIFTLISDFAYILNTPATDVRIPFETKTSETVFLVLHYGSCFYMSFIAGFISIIFGLTLSLLQFLRLYSISTCLSGYLDDTVRPKCQWRNNRTKQTIENKKTSQNGWTTMESSSSSTRTPSSSSSTNGDNTETYITDETASAGDIMLSANNHYANDKITSQKKSLAIETPDSGIEMMMNKNILNFTQNSTPNTPKLIKQSMNKNKLPFHNTGNGSSSEMLNRRVAFLFNSNNLNKWNQPSTNTIQLPSLNNIKKNNNNNSNQLRFGKYLNGNASLNSSKITSELSPTSIKRFKNKEINFLTNDLHRGESSGFQSSRSSFSSCSLNNEGEPNSRKVSLLMNAFCFTDDEEELPQNKKKNSKVTSLNNTDYLQQNPFKILF